jgi:homoserine acetyltransferase
LAAEDGGLKDEYGLMDDSGDTFIANDFQLDCGRSLNEAQVRYKTWGKLNEAGDNGTPRWWGL